ncbi:MAG: mechanosensitive ion channel family protein [Methanomicrobiales archaeon]
MTNPLGMNVTSLPIREIDPGTILTLIYIIVAAWLAVKILSWLLRKISEKAGQYRFTVTMVIPLLKLIIYLAALYFALQQVLQPSIPELIAFFGLFGAAVGFGLKDILADIIGGLVVTFERPYQIGDKIAVKEQYGEVSDIGLRATRIITPDDARVSIPNYTIFQEAVSSGNAGDTEMMVVIDIHIDPASDADLALRILREAVVTSKYIYITPKRPYTLLVRNFPFYVRIRAKAYVNDHRSEFVFASDVTRRAWAEMKKEGIRPPPIPPEPVETP